MGDRTLLANQATFAGARRERIAELVLRNGAVRISDLSQLYGVSEVTIRHDLDVLASQGLLVRKRGGALATIQTALASRFDRRSHINLEAKHRIGKYAAQLVAPGDTIIMDAGTTVLEMAKSIRAVASLTVVTTALNIAMEVGRLPGCHVILLGGSLSIETISTVGALAERDLNDLVVSKLFLGAHTVDLELGVVDTSIEVARVKRAMTETAREVILLADSSKWQAHRREAFVRVAPLVSIKRVITDSGLPDEVCRSLTRSGVELTIV